MNGEKGYRDWADLPAVLTIGEAARFLRLGYRTVLNLCHSRDRSGFPAQKFGRAWRISRDALKRWLDERAGSGGVGYGSR